MSVVFMLQGAGQAEMPQDEQKARFLRRTFTYGYVVTAAEWISWSR